MSVDHVKAPQAARTSQAAMQSPSAQCHFRRRGRGEHRPAIAGAMQGPPRGAALLSVYPAAALVDCFSGHSFCGRAPAPPPAAPKCRLHSGRRSLASDRHAAGAVAGAGLPSGWCHPCSCRGAPWLNHESRTPARRGPSAPAERPLSWAASEPWHGAQPLGLATSSWPEAQRSMPIPPGDSIGRARPGKAGLLPGLAGDGAVDAGRGRPGRQGGEGGLARLAGATGGPREGGGGEALLPALEHRRRAVTAALEDALRKHRVSPTYAGQVLRQLPHILDALLLHAVRLKTSAPELALEPFSSRAATAVHKSRIAPAVRSLQRLGLSPGRTAHLVGAAARAAALGTESTAPSAPVPVPGEAQGSEAGVAPLEDLEEAMERLAQNMAWLNSVCRKGLRRPGQLAKLAEADGWALLHMPLQELKERSQAMWRWLGFTGSMAEQWVHQVHCQPGLLTQPPEELAARLALLYSLAEQRLTLGPLHNARVAQRPGPMPGEAPAEEAHPDRAGTGDTAGVQHILEQERDSFEREPAAGEMLQEKSWPESREHGNTAEEGWTGMPLESTSTASGVTPQLNAGDGWQELGQLGDGERTSDAQARTALAPSNDTSLPVPALNARGETGPGGCVSLEAALASDAVRSLSSAGAALVRRMVQRTPALLSSSVPLQDLQAKVVFLRGTLGVPAGHVGRMCVSHPRVLLAHLRTPPGGTPPTHQAEGGPAPSVAGPNAGCAQGTPGLPSSRSPASAGAGAVRGCACWYALLLYLHRQGLSTEDVAGMVQKHPLLLTLDLAASVSPKMAFFRSSGMSPSRMRTMLLQAPHLLSYSLAGRIKPLVTALYEQAGVEREALGVLLGMHPDLLSSHSRLPRALSFFRDTVGVSPQQLGCMLASFPQLLGYSPRGLEEKWALYREVWGEDLKPLVDFPRFFSYSLENRVRQRATLLQKAGLLDSFSLQGMLECSDQAFDIRIQTALAGNSSKLDS